ncbi:MAG: RNA polymerase subunit sigma-70, partial [Acidobacteria bacterium]
MSAPALSPVAVTDLLNRSRLGSVDALNTLTPILYSELRRIAGGYLRRERPGQTLQATALVNEAYLRLLKDASLSFANRAHFLGIAAQAMREILVERARARGAAKRGGQRARVTLEESLAQSPAASVDVLALNRALDRLNDCDPQQA